MITVEYSTTDHDLKNEVSQILDCGGKQNIKVTGMGDVDYDSIQGAFYLSGQAYVEFSFEESFLKDAYHLLSICELCESRTLWSYDADEVKKCPVSNETLQDFVFHSMPWSEFQKTDEYKNFISSGTTEELYDKAWDMSNFTDLLKK
jgi:hypothetical protein